MLIGLDAQFDPSASLGAIPWEARARDQALWGSVFKDVSTQHETQIASRWKGADSWLAKQLKMFSGRVSTNARA